MWNDAFALAALMSPKHIDRVHMMPMEDKIKGEAVLRKLMSASDAAAAQGQLKVA